MKFTIYVPEKVSLNTAMRKHYRAVNELKQEWHWAVAEAHVPPWEGSYPVDIRFHYFLNGKAMDSSNTGFMSKALEDALVEAGVFPDDNPKFVRWSSNRSDQAVKGYPDMVVVEILSTDST